MAEYRRATIADTDTLISYRKKAQIESGASPVNTIDAELRDYFGTALADGSFISWLAEENGDVVSSCGMCFYQLLPSFSNPTGRVAYITTVYTEPEHRKRGLATRLIGKIIQEASDLRYTVIRLHSSKAGRQLYEKLGFRAAEGYMDLRVLGER